MSNAPDPKIPAAPAAAGTESAPAADAQGQTPADLMAMFAGEITDDTPIDALPPGLRKHVRELRKQAAAAREKEKAAQAAAEQERIASLEKKGEFETLVNELKAKVEPLESRVTSLTKAITRFNQTRIDSMLEADRALVPDLDDPVMISQWLDKYFTRAVTPTQQPPPGNDANGQGKKPPPNTNAGTNGAGKTDATGAQKEAQKRQAYEDARRMF